MNPWFMGLLFAEILFFKHLIVSGTQKSGRAVKTAWGLDSNPGAALDSCVTFASHPCSLSFCSSALT